MANILSTVLGAVTPFFQTDNVAVFTQGYRQIFRAARILKAVVKEQAKIMEHPVETGIVITDHRVIQPVEIELSLILNSRDYKDVYATIRQYYLAGTLLVVQTRAGVYENQIIESLPHEEDPTIYDALTVALSLKEVIFVTAQYGVVPKNPRNSTTQKRGTQQGTPASSGSYASALTGLKPAGAFKGAAT
jgi:hypothetical protein